MSDPKQPEGPDSRDIREIIRQELHEEFYAHRMEHRMRAKLHRRRDFFRDHRQAHQPQGEDPRHHHGAPHPLRGGPWRMHFAIRRKLFIWFGITLGIGLFVGHWVAVAGYHRGWALAASFLVLWMASGGIAWQLTFPLVAVVRTARAIGNGEWSARIKTRRRSGEIRVLADAINGMAERIEKQLSDQKQLLAAVSHELRTPLGHMRVLIDSAREGAGGDRAFDELEREVADLDNLVGKLLASSRLEFGQLDRHVINVATMVADAAVQAGVDPDAIVASGDTQADVDPTLLRRAVANLLDNARIHGGGATAVRVSFARNENIGEIVVEIDDAGPGVPQARRADAFRPFVPSNAGGLGLGLALVQRIAIAHGGRAWISDCDGVGARVGFAVPVGTGS